MILIIQIYLTYRAWKSGWGLFSIIPVTAAILAGVVINSGTASFMKALVPAMLVDLVCVIVLTVMAYSRHLTQNTSQTTKSDIDFLLEMK